MSFDAATLLRLLPAIHRLRDAELAAATGGLLAPDEVVRLEQLEALPAATPKEVAERNALRAKAVRGPLETLLAVFSDEIAVVEENLEQLDDDLFIETCAEWAIPYVGDLIGYEPLHDLGGARGLARAEVAHTIALRRRKGTASVLEQLARDVTGWNARAVEFFQLLATTQHMNHLRPWNHYAPDLRRHAPLARIGSAFDSVAHTTEVRRIESGRGRFNIPNVGIFLWRLDAYRHARSPSIPVDDRRWLVSPLGHALQLITAPVAEDEIAHLAEPGNVPDPITRRALHDDVAAHYGTGATVAHPADNADPSIVLYVDGSEVAREDVVACDLSDHAGAWAHVPPDGTYGIDPVLGRIALAANLPVPQSVRVTYHYAFSADMGGGEYARVREPDPEDGEVLRVPADHATIQAALDALGGNGVVEISDGDRHQEPIDVHVAQDGHVVLRAAQGRRPVLVPPADLVVTGGARSAFTIEGMLVIGARLSVPAAGNLLSRVRVAHSTFVPGRALDAHGDPVLPGAESIAVGRPDVVLVVQRSIVGALRIDVGSTCSATDSIIDANAAESLAYAAPIASEPGGTVRLDACTVIGRLTAVEAELVSNSILLARRVQAGGPAVRVVKRQKGCVRFSFLPPDSLVPPRHRCQPRAAGSGVVPHFTTLRYGEPAYCQLARSTPEEIRRGADDESEMGAFHAVFAAQREANLGIRLREYLRVGLSAGVFHES